MIEALTSVDWSRWILPAVFLAAGVLLGVLAEYGAMRRVRDRVGKTRWRWDDLLVDSVRGMVFLWVAVAGVYASRQAATLPDIVAIAVDKLVVVALGLSFTVVAARLAAAGIRGWTQTAEGALPSTSLLQNVARIIVFVLGAFLILQNLGIEVGALVASLGIGGLAVALALQDTLSNLFAGFQIILARQVRNGDFVRLDTGEEGYVTDIQWRNTTIKSRMDDHEVVVPNSKLANAIVTNFDLPSRPFWLRLDVGVSYDSDLEEVERVTLEVAEEVMEELGLEDMPDPIVRFRGFGDSAITFRLRIRVDDYARQFAVRHELVKRVHARYREEGIEIPFPIRTVYAPKGVDVRGGGEGRPERTDAPAEETRD
ncbi:MAG: mechanosensitive ion channel family protein, partial [Gemmatimonadota bacterium]